MAELTMIEAIRAALDHAMREDDTVVILGEDVGIDGGVFRATDGLVQRHGSARVLDTPLAEAAIAGIAVGAAVQGLRPIAEIQFAGFIYPAIDQLVNHAGRMRNRTRGRLSCPMVLRAPFGGGINAPEHHSESPEAMLAHIPGIRVVMPSSPARAHGLLLSAIRDPDPVVFLEPKRLYRAGREAFEEGTALPLDQAFRVREGADITIVSWGAMIAQALGAASDLAEEGVEADVIDLATLKPYDADTVVESVRRTGRCLVVHEAPRTAGFGAEIAACVAEQALASLLAPVRRIAGYDTVMPLPRLEKAYMPTAERIAAAARELMAWR